MLTTKSRSVSRGFGQFAWLGRDAKRIDATW